MMTTKSEEKSNGAEKENWFKEQISDGFKLYYERESDPSCEPVSGTSDFQSWEVFETVTFGRVLVVDKLLQCSTFDEYVYHESLVHPALVLHPCPRDVMILGGGEGATLREVLKHSTVEQATMVDIDQDVVEATAKYCPHFPNGAYEDRRSKVIYADAKGVVEGLEDASLDVLICDLNDPIEGGPCWQLYTKEFYQTCFKKLRVDGVLVTQAGCCSVWLHTEEHSEFSAIHNTLRSVFPPRQVLPYGVFLPSFTDEWGFQLCFKAPQTETFMEEAVMGATIDARLRHRGLFDELKYYDTEAHRKMMAIPKPVRHVLNIDETIITAERPYYLSNYDGETDGTGVCAGPKPKGQVQGRGKGYDDSPTDA